MSYRNAGRIASAAFALLASASPLAAASAQTLGSGLLPTPDSAVAPVYPLSVPNSGRPLDGIRAITGFGRVFAYGSSSVNTRMAVPQGLLPVWTEVFTNSHAIGVELMSPLVGAYNGRGKDFTTATNFAAGSSTSATALTGQPAGCTIGVNCQYEPQIVQFTQTYGRYAANDIVLQWSGINDFSIGGVGTPAILDSRVAQNVANQTEMVRQNLALGARTTILVGLADLATLNYFVRPGSNSVPALLTEGARRVNDGMLANLVALHNQTGANLRYFDLQRLVAQIRANPTAYGFSAEGAQPGASCTTLGPLNADTPCGRGSFAEQNRYLTLDGIHWTYRGHAIIAEAMANQLLAPYTVAPQADLADATARRFAGTLLGRLDARRGPETVSGDAGQPFALFASGAYGDGRRDERPGGTGMEYRAGGLTIGGEYRIAPGLLVGAAFGYAAQRADLDHWYGGEVTLKSYQFGGFASYSTPTLFADAAVTAGIDDHEVRRPGLVDTLQGSPGGNSLVAGVRGGYLFDLGRDSGGARLGPVAGLQYSTVWIDAYSERGDGLLTQRVERQRADSLTGSLGAQLRVPFEAAGRPAESFLNLTVEHGFLDGARTLTTAQTYAPALTVATRIDRSGARTYGRLAAGAGIDATERVRLRVGAETTVARRHGNDLAVTADVSYRF